MNLSEPIVFCGKLVSCADRSVDITALTDGCSLYQSVLTVDHSPLWIDLYLARLEQSLDALYGICHRFDRKSAVDSIMLLLDAGNYGRGGNVVDIVVTPDGSLSVLYNSLSLYNSYAHFASMPRAVVVNYQIPFEQHRTLASLSVARYMDSYARRQGAQVALRVNRSGQIISSGDSAAFAVVDNRLFVAPDCSSVERDMVVSICRKSGVEVEQSAATIDLLDQIDEIFIARPSGIVSLSGVGNRRFMSVVAQKIADRF